MSVIGAFVVPHPPISIPDIGKGEEQKIYTTINSYMKVADKIAAIKPETIVIVSPHATSYSDYIHISPGKMASGDMSAFNAPSVFLGADYDTDFVQALCQQAIDDAFPAGMFGESDPSLDHGTLIPLYYISQKYTDFSIVRIGVSGLSYAEHYKLGMMIQKTANGLSRSTVIIGSGDLSHRLKADGPYGFAKEGAIYDSTIMSLLERAAFNELFDFDENLCSLAGECGQRSFCIMAGALNSYSVSAKKLSYEDTFGVGYGLVEYIVTGTDITRDFYGTWNKAHDEKIAKSVANEDAFVSLARKTINEFITNDKITVADDSLPDYLLNKRAGVFVSLHLNGKLRGCIGTISPVQKNIAEEIINNAIAAAVRDPRFSPLTIRELKELHISVDELFPPEDINSKDLLNVKEYGIIVTQGDKRGLLLPNLDGIDTINQQITIAKDKAGIDVTDDNFTMQRFKVIRH